MYANVLRVNQILRGTTMNKILIILACLAFIFGITIYSWSKESTNAMSQEGLKNEKFVIKKISNRNICLEKYFRHLCNDKEKPYTRYY